VAVARHFTELIVWQLADQLRIEVFQLTKRGRFHTDFKLRSQLDDAADSACRNIAEGFGGTDREFANFLRIARRSLNEVQDGFRSARLKEHVSEADLKPARSLLRRIFPALSSLLRHLDRRIGRGRPRRPSVP
jgi:four helix bundle protein